MSRINTNVQSLIAQRILSGNNQMLSQSLERLSTGLRINRGKDDPAGLIVSERLRSEIGATNAAISNAERADQVVNIAEGGLQEVSSLLTELQGLVTTSASTAGLSIEEKEANQLQIDSILQTIDRISSATSFQGIKLLNGNFDYQVSNIDSAVDAYTVNGAKFNSGSSVDVDVVITQSAQLAGQFLSFGAATLDLQSSGGTFTIEISGSEGSRELTFNSSVSMENIADAINTFTDVTGVIASSVVGGTGVTINSDQYGSSQFVSVKIVDDGGVQQGTVGIYSFDPDAARTLDAGSVVDFDSDAASNGQRDVGQDLGATINGQTATSNGRDLRINTDFLDVKLTINSSNAEALGTIDAFEITGGGADFQLAPNVDIAGKVSIGLQEVASRKLGQVDVSTTTGETDFRFLDDMGSGKLLNVVDGDLTAAQDVIANAISEVSGIRGRLGAFQKNVVSATIRSLNIANENTAAAQSLIRDADFAAETASLTRNQILVSASTNVLSLANSQPQQVLQLLG